MKPNGKMGPQLRLAVCNQKGGVGKTTTAVNLASALQRMGRRTLLVDMDPQGNATAALGVTQDGIDGTAFDLMASTLAPHRCIVGTEEGIDLVPGSPDLSVMHIRLDESEEQNPEIVLRQRLAEVTAMYDVMIFDCPPTLNILTISSLAAASKVLVPIQCEFFALEGLRQLRQTIEELQEATGETIEIFGLLRTMYDGRQNLDRTVSMQLEEAYGAEVLNTIIPRNVRLAEAPAAGRSVLSYDKSSRGTEAYLMLAGEIARMMETRAA